METIEPSPVPVTSAQTEFTSEAHGRVNLMGEHTDYNGGYVLPTAIPQKTVVHLRLRKDKQVKVVSRNFEENSSYGYTLGRERVRHGWVDYVQGVTQVLAQSGHAIGGFDATFDSTVPIGSGLSSSAALEIALLRALRQAFDLKFTDVQAAQMGQQLENEFVGARVGIMDQMSSSLAALGSVLFLDTRDLSFTTLRLPLDLMDMVVLNSGIKHQHAGGEYNTRRAECEEACLQLGIEELRDFSLAELGKAKKNLPDVLFRRVRHVVTENDRVLSCVAALRTADFATVGRLLNECHASLRDDYEVSVPQMDALVQTAQATPGVFGARMTGGGFGGSLVMLTKKGLGRTAAEQVQTLHAQKFPDAQTTLLVH